MKTKTAVLNGKPDAGNPHVRFDEGEVASYPPTVGRPEGVATRGAKPRRGSLLYKSIGLLAALSAFVTAAATDEITEFRDGMPFAKEGFGVRRNFYMSGRISAKASDIANVFQLNYIGRQKHTALRFYDSNENCTFGRFMVSQVIIGERRYRLTFENTTHYPFGYSSECTLDGVRLRHEFVLDGNVAFRRITELENPERKPVRAVCVLINGNMKGLKLKMNELKTALVGTRDDAGVVTTVEMGSANAVDFPLNDRSAKPLAFNGDGTLSFRFDVIERAPAREHLFWMVFDRKDGEDLSSTRVDRVYSDLKAKCANDARFLTGDAVVDNALGFCMPWGAAEEVDGIGAFRASPTYWVWGWDAMVHYGVQAMTGRAAEVKRMLEFFREIADPKFGILHSYQTDFKVEQSDADRLGSLRPGGSVTMAPHVQLFYVVLLHDYYCLTGDRATLDALLPFAKTLVDRARAKARPGEALCREYGFFPDNPYAVEQQKDDISLINNAIYYQGLCAYADLTDEMKDECEAVRKALAEKLWDAKEGFWSDAYDVHVNVRRPHYPVYGLFHISPFAQTAEVAPWDALADYMKRRFFNNSYLAMFSPQSESHLADGNQLGAYYPVADRTYWNVMNAAGRIDALADYREIVRRHWRVLTYPEGQCSDVWNNDPADYSDELGNKQFFASKSWLADALELNLGVKWSVKGLSFHAIGDGTPFSAENLSLRGKKLTVRRTGAGAFADYVFNGVRLETPFIPWASLKSANSLVINCRMGQ